MMLDIHVMLNGHLSKQGFCCPASHENNMGSKSRVHRSHMFFLKLTAAQVPFSIRSQVQVIVFNNINDAFNDKIMFNLQF